jgi:PhoPQ-activated pathogenicity-related protein
VIIPENVKENKQSWSTLYMTGGKNEGEPEHFKTLDEDILVTAAIAVETGVVTSVLFQVPNQHIIFADDPL